MLGFVLNKSAMRAAERAPCAGPVGITAYALIEIGRILQSEVVGD